jgi:superfamily I DNA and/or RNA helicase
LRGKGFHIKSTVKLNPESRSKKLVYLYRFDKNQEFKGGAKTYSFLNSPDKSKILKADFIKEHSDLKDGIIALESSNDLPTNSAIIPEEYINSQVIKSSIQEQVKHISSGIASNLLSENALMDFLFRRTPNIIGRRNGSAIVADNDSDKLGAIISAIMNLDNSYLAIQGPPGAGKTFTAKHVIVELLKSGKRIGICSNSHKAIHNLLIGTAEYAEHCGVRGHYIVTQPIGHNDIDAIVTKNGKISGLVSPSCVIGTTAWGFAREDMIDQLDYLFIDEAGQVSLANFIAISRSSKNIVLMGDQMQLGQPTQSTHPDDSGLSILDYLMQDKAIIPSDKGIFLDKTYRMHQAVNQFISDAIYEGKLKADKSNQSQVILGSKEKNCLVPLEAGILYCPVAHTGNTQSSDEEVEVILDITDSLLGRVFIDKSGGKRKITFDDILFVAPYNHQVSKLQEKLGETAKVGSVDKFQGQEAPIVILSMCASDADSSPRGVGFLFDKNRLNVAVSRSQSITVVVASEKLVSSSANNIDQMKLINTYCHLVSYAGDLQR